MGDATEPHAPAYAHRQLYSLPGASADHHAQSPLRVETDACPSASDGGEGVRGRQAKSTRRAALEDVRAGIVDGGVFESPFGVSAASCQQSTHGLCTRASFARCLTAYRHMHKHTHTRTLTRAHTHTHMHRHGTLSTPTGSPVVVPMNPLNVSSVTTSFPRTPTHTQQSRPQHTKPPAIGTRRAM